MTTDRFLTSSRTNLFRLHSMMRTSIVLFAAVILAACTSATAAEKDLDVAGRTLISRKPMFSLTLPREHQVVHSSVQEFPKESSRTRAYLLIRPKSKQVEEMVIIQIADRMNPAAEPMNVPSLAGDAGAIIYDNGKVKKEKNEIQHLIQLITWNRNAPSLNPILKGGFEIPPHTALQGQILFGYAGEHAVLLKYSKDVNSFGFDVSGREDQWRRASISGNKKKALDMFAKDFKEMIDSLTFKTP